MQVTEVRSSPGTLQHTQTYSRLSPVSSETRLQQIYCIISNYVNALPRYFMGGVVNNNPEQINKILHGEACRQGHLHMSTGRGCVIVMSCFISPTNTDTTHTVRDQVIIYYQIEKHSSSC